MVFAFSPAIADNAKDSQRRKGQINDAFVECLGGSFAQLLRRTRTDRTMRPGRPCSRRQEHGNDQNDKRLVHGTSITYQRYDIINQPLQSSYSAGNASALPRRE